MNTLNAVLDVFSTYRDIVDVGDASKHDIEWRRARERLAQRLSTLLNIHETTGCLASRVVFSDSLSRSAVARAALLPARGAQSKE